MDRETIYWQYRHKLKKYLQVPAAVPAIAAAFKAENKKKYIIQ